MFVCIWSPCNPALNICAARNFPVWLDGRPEGLAKWNAWASIATSRRRGRQGEKGFACGNGLIETLRRAPRIVLRLEEPQSAPSVRRLSRLLRGMRYSHFPGQDTRKAKPHLADFAFG
jgi:hypothetical protein